MSYEIEKPKVKPVEVITIDEKPYVVDQMSEEIQQIVEVFNRWNVQEADIQHEINLLADKISMMRAAKETVSRQILDKVRTEQEEAANAEGGEIAEAEITE